jgi:hypothetical protein
MHILIFISKILNGSQDLRNAADTRRIDSTGKGIRMMKMKLRKERPCRFEVNGSLSLYEKLEFPLVTGGA